MHYCTLKQALGLCCIGLCWTELTGTGLFRCFQPPFNQFTYQMVGDGNSVDYFAVNPNSGDVTVKRNLGDDTNLNYTVSTINHDDHNDHFSDREVDDDDHD